MSIRRTLAELHEWLIMLPVDFIFLLVLPFVVAIVGVIADRGQPPQNEHRVRRRRTATQRRAPFSPAPS